MRDEVAEEEREGLWEAVIERGMVAGQDLTGSWGPGWMRHGGVWD